MVAIHLLRHEVDGEGGFTSRRRARERIVTQGIGHPMEG